MFHWQCYADPQALAALDMVVEQGSTRDLRLLATSSPATIEISASGYVLVLNCDGAVVRAAKVTGL